MCRGGAVIAITDLLAAGLYFEPLLIHLWRSDEVALSSDGSFDTSLHHPGGRHASGERLIGIVAKENFLADGIFIANFVGKPRIRDTPNPPPFYGVKSWARGH